jgi:hypothetical protein
VDKSSECQFSNAGVVLLRRGLGAGAIGDLDQPNDQLINIRCTNSAFCEKCYGLLHLTQSS